MESGFGGSRSSFTVNGDFFALLSVDGRLRIWDTSSGKLVQEFSPALHVESSCTCLCWTRGISDKNKKEPRRKKRKVVKTETNDSIAHKPYPSLLLGTKSGTLRSYDPVAGDIGGKFDDGHLKSVNNVLYHKDTDTSYSCSDDKYIIEWSYDSHEAISKWKADKVSVKRICLGPSGTTLLSAGQSIKLWNLETKELLQRFHGHTSPVSLLQFSPFQMSRNKSDTYDDGYYFLSGSTEDSIINAWHINIKNPEKTAIASYMLSDVPSFMDSLLITTDNQPLKLCVGCRDGRIHFFSNTMNGKTKRPLESSKTLDLLQREGERSNTTTVPFLKARLYDENGMVLLLVSGTSLKPMFKRFVYSKLEETTRIIQELTQNMLLKDVISDSDNAVEIADQKAKTKVIGNTNFTPIPLKNRARPTLDLNANEQDRSNTTSEENIVSMEERLKVAGHGDMLVPKIKPSKSIPNASSFAQMLVQGLHSGDNTLINEILFKSCKDNILRNTVKRIPNNLVGLLLSEVVDKLQRNPARSKVLSSWLRVIMAVHLTYLMTNENLSGTLGSLYNILKMQQDIHPQLINLNGKIDLLLSHASSNKRISSEDDESTNATVVFNDNSDDETEELFGKLIESEEEIEVDEEENSQDEEESDDTDDDEIDDNEIEQSENESDQY